MTEKVVRFSDYEKRSRNPDAIGPRDPCEADIIEFPRIPFKTPFDAWVEALDQFEFALDDFRRSIAGMYHVPATPTDGELFQRAVKLAALSSRTHD